MDESIPIAKFKDRVSECINRVMYKGDRILLERHRKDNAALVSLEDYEFLKRMALLHKSVLKDIDEIDIKGFKELLKSVGTENLHEFLSACKLSNIRKAITKEIVDIRKKNKCK